MSQKIFRDPLYNYIEIDAGRDSWLLDAVNSREVQRLRRIHQLGVSSFTYPGAEHTRFNHSLGVLHLMQLALSGLGRDHPKTEFERAVPALLAAALVHDVGHGPFSHLFEPCLGIDHEVWSQKIVTDPACEVFHALSSCDPTLPHAVAKLIDPKNVETPQWQKALISSQLDMDRLDYLRRDSLFTGAGYGKFDWHRLVTSMQLHGDRPNQSALVWPDKAKMAIEEYIFARYYMYQNVYLHKTTRGFEKMLEAMWGRARQLHGEGEAVGLMPAIAEFWGAETPDTRQYLRLEEFTVLSQIQAWEVHHDPALSDLARRFLARRPFAKIDAPDLGSALDADLSDWNAALRSLVAADTRFQPPEMYCLVDSQKPKYHLPYIPEKEDDEQTVRNSIRLHLSDGRTLMEISRRLKRLQAFTREVGQVVRYYVPRELRDEALRLQKRFSRADAEAAPGG